MGKHKRRSRDRDEEDDLRSKICRLEQNFDEFIKKFNTQQSTIPDRSQNDLESKDNNSLNQQDVDLESDNVEKEVIIVKDEQEESALVQVSADTNTSGSISEEAALEEEVEYVLGVNPSAETKKTVDLHQSLIARWPTWLSEGLTKEDKETVLDKYPRKGNIHLEAPELNEEVLATLNDSGVKRDKLFTVEQNIVGSAMSAVGDSITMILKDEEEPVNRLLLLEKLADAGKLLAQLHFQISSARRIFISPVLSKPMKDLLQKTKPGVFLYGENLQDKIKAVKSMEKISKEMKSATASSSAAAVNKSFKSGPRTSVSRPLNWRSPYANQGQSYLGQKSYQKFPKKNQQKYSTSYSQNRTNRPAQQEKK